MLITSHSVQGPLLGGSGKPRRMSIEERLEMHERYVNERLMLAELTLGELGRSDSARASVIPHSSSLH